MVYKMLLSPLVAHVPILYQEFQERIRDSTCDEKMTVRVRPDASVSFGEL